MIELMIRTSSFAGHVRVGGEERLRMADDRWIGDIFTHYSKSKEKREEEKAYALESRRKFLAEIDPFFAGIRRDLNAAVETFNAHFDADATKIVVIANDAELWSAKYQPPSYDHPLDIKVRLNKERDRVTTTLMYQERTFRVMQRDGLQLWHEEGGRGLVTNTAKELLWEFFRTIANY